MAAVGANKVGEDFGDKGFFFRVFDSGNELFPEFGDEFFPSDLVFSDELEVVFHRGSKGDVHDEPEIVFEHAGDHGAELSGTQGSLFFDGIVAALDLLHDRRVGRGASDA